MGAASAVDALRCLVVVSPTQASIRNLHPRSAHVVATHKLDLLSQAAVHAWCDAWLSGSFTRTSTSSDGGSSSSGSTCQPPVLDVLVNNAGANFMGIQPFFTEQGVAGLPQVNCVGPVTLTRRLLPSLWAARAPRVVNVASVMHRVSSLPADPQWFLTDWWQGGAYRNCKHFNVVFSLLLQQAADKVQAGVACMCTNLVVSIMASAQTHTRHPMQVAAHSTGGTQPPPLTVVAVDPGAVYSNIWATSKILGRPPGSTVISWLFAKPEDACATSVHAAAGRGVRGGQYYARGMFAEGLIVKDTWEPSAAALSCLDWPLRNLSNGRLMARVQAVDIAPQVCGCTGYIERRGKWCALGRLG
jgi:NAD(P)-dependent dehydrogenase (short-subunit alcohol dehydrogenase family)